MEEVEAANKAAVESFHRIISLLAQPHDHVHHKNLIDLTGDLVIGFKKVASLLDKDLSHSRVRIFKKFQTVIPQNILQENDHKFQPKPIQMSNLSLSNQYGSLELSSNGKNSIRIPQNTPLPFPRYHFFQHQQKYQIKQQAEMMYRRPNGGYNLNFDSSTCTPSMSSNRSSSSSSRGYYRCSSMRGCPARKHVER